MRLAVLLLALIFALVAQGAEKRDCGPVPLGGQFDENCKLSLVPPPPSYFKGLELYSWSERGKWFFSLVPGRNAEQEKADVLKSKVEGVSELKKRLSGVASGAEVYWNTRSMSGLTLKTPPKHLAHEIEQACKQWNIKLIK